VKVTNLSVNLIEHSAECEIDAIAVGRANSAVAARTAVEATP
jgi:hypothetical protein